MTNCGTWLRLAAASTALAWAGGAALAQTPAAKYPPSCNTMRCITNADRQAAAERAAAKRAAAGQRKGTPALPGPTSPKRLPATTALKATTSSSALAQPAPSGAQIDYLSGLTPHSSISPALRKFVDSLPGLGLPGCVLGNPADPNSCHENNLGQYIPVANPKTGAPGVPADGDYYEIGLSDYTQQLHSDLPKATRLRGYADLNGDGRPHYLGPVIVAVKNRPVRIKFVNNLSSTPNGGDLFIPVDTTIMGAGRGTLFPDGSPCDPRTQSCALYPQNRAELHLHGGDAPWISDGTPHQWIVPAAELPLTPYKKGVSTQNVPDMPDPGDGAVTYYWPNKLSSRLMFYHDHAWGITRLNVYAGEAAGYLLVDPIEQQLVTAGILPNNGGGIYAYGIPLVIQDKGFVSGAPADPTTGAPATGTFASDPTWPAVVPPGTGQAGDLWFPHVYMPNQNPYDLAGTNPMGRWDYGPWFWPPVTTAAGLVHGGVQITGTGTNGCPVGQTCEVPGTPNPSLVPESFMDTPLVNGTAFPYMTVARQPYRFRILNASNDRYLNLQLYCADATGTEVKMVDAVPHTACTSPTQTTACTCTGNAAIDPAGCFPKTWPTDARAGGVPDPATAGPAWIQIGTEGGFLPAPAVIPQQPVNYDYNRRSIVVLNVTNKALYLGSAERADVIVDFSQFPASCTNVILYNDAPAPMPAGDPRNDYFTNGPDLSATGGSPTIPAGYGPNIRTIMQFRLTGAQGAPFDVTALQAAFASSVDASGNLVPGAFAQAQPTVVVPQKAYGAAYNVTTFPDTYSTIQANSLTFTPVGQTAPVTMPMGSKTIQELFELDYGRMNSSLGVELPLTNFRNQTTIPYYYIDPTTDWITQGDTQLWKITHNGVDTHVTHFHLFNVQVVNRVGWDGAVRLPDANELGWKDSVRMNPLEDIVVALRPIKPEVPFPLPDSKRLLNPAMPVGATTGFTGIDPANNNPITVTNTEVNFGWEYVWHCHLLGHEENDMMRPIAFQVPPEVPSNLAAVWGGSGVLVTFTDGSVAETGFTLQRAEDPAFTLNVVPTALAANPGHGGVVSYTDTSASPVVAYYYRVQAFSPNGSSAWSNTAAAGSPPFATISATALAFADQLVGTRSAGQAVTVTNGGTTTLTVVGISVAGTHPTDFAQVNDCAASVAAGASCTITVTFGPTAMGARAGSLVIQTNDAMNPSQTVTLSGTGVAPVASVAPTALAFGTQMLLTSATQTATVTNAGSAPLTLGAVTLANGTAAAYTVTADTCSNATLAANGTCTVTVQFLPTTFGALSGALQLPSDDPARPVVSVVLSGTGAAPIAGLSPASVAFATTLVNTTAAGATVTLSNAGTLPLALTSLAITGDTVDFLQTNACPNPLPAGQSCAVTVSFRPTVIGPLSAALTLTSNDPVNPTLSVALTGTGSAISLSATALSFGNQVIGTTGATRTITVSNNSNAAVAMGAIAVAGTDAADFVVTGTTCGTSLTALRSCTVSLRFSPTVAGSKAATLSVASADPASPHTVALTGTALGAPALTVSPTALAFQSSMNVTSAAQTVTVTNSGGSPVTLNGVTLGGTNANQFAQTSTCPASLATATSCTITVTFRPNTTGLTKTATLTVNAAAPATSQTVGLTGTVLVPTYTVSPTSLAFGNVAIRTVSAAQTVTVTNTSTVALGVTRISLSTTQYAQTNTCGTSLAAGASCTISVTFRPTQRGARTGTLSLNVAAPATGSTVALTGTGQ